MAPIPQNKTGRLFSCLVTGLTLGLLNVFFSASFSSLIFKGDLSALVPAGTSVILFGACIMGLVISSTSSLPGMIASPQAIPAAVLSVLVASAAASLSPAMTPWDKFTALAAIMGFATSLTGLFFLSLGLSRMGNLIRFIPYPVFGGFMAGTGWILVKGAFGILAGAGFSGGLLEGLFSIPGVVSLLPGLFFGCLLLLLQRRQGHPLLIPLAVVLFLGCYLLVLRAVGFSISEASSLLNFTSREGPVARPMDFVLLLSEIRFSSIFQMAGNMTALLIVSVVALLLNASAIELVTEQDLDLNQELRSAGIANLAAGLSGSPVGFQALSDTTLGRRMSANARLSGVVCALVCGAAFFFGDTIISLIPRPMAGGLLFYLGAGFLLEWVYDAWFRLNRSDYFLVILILFITSLFGFFKGISAGVVVAAVFFVVKYSKIDVVSVTFSGSSYASNVDRPQGEQALLKEKGESLYILKLQGFIFFGTASNLLQRVRRRCADERKPSLSYMLLDFSRVTGFDSSALHSFSKLKQLSRKSGFTLGITGLSRTMWIQLTNEGFFKDPGHTVTRVFPDLDHGVEWCEEKILADAKTRKEPGEISLHRRLADAFGNTELADRMLGYLIRESHGPGVHLMEQDQPPAGFYFVESGHVTARLLSESGSTMRLRKMGPGTVVGELGLYMRSPASASVVTNGPCVVYRLEYAKLDEMEQNDPLLAAAFHKFMVMIMCRRLLETNRTLAAYMS